MYERSLLIAINLYRKKYTTPVYASLALFMAIKAVKTMVCGEGMRGKKSNEISHHRMAITIEFYFTLVVNYCMYITTAVVQYYIVLFKLFRYRSLGTNIFGRQIERIIV